MLELKQTNGGFSLIEVLIVLVIVAILASIAVPSYRSSMLKSHRTDAKDALLSAAAMQERLYMQNNQYSADVDDIGGSESPDGYYTISVVQPGDVITRYVLTASVAGKQTDDTQCARFTLNQAGLRKAFDIDGADASKCW